MSAFERLHSRCACAGAPFALPGTERQYERSRPFVTRHLRLDISLDLPRKMVQGSARIEIERISPLDDVLVLDAVAFELQRVRLLVGKQWRDAEYQYDHQQIAVSIPKRATRATVEVHYSARPRRGLYFLAPDEHVRSRPLQVWSQCQDEDARHWFPCQDKPHVKMTTELIAHVPAKMTVLSNGELVESHTPERGRGPWRYHFAMKQPHPSYLVTLVVGQFSVLKGRNAKLSDGTQVPVGYYVPPGREADGRRAFQNTPEMIELFSRLTGVDYPWDRYSQVVVSDFIFGGMENTTATTMYEHILLDERAALDIESNDLVAHELAHQWFGDLVTCRDWSHAWLNEGFATYFEQVEREHRLGRDEYEYGVATDLDTYLAEAQGRYQRPIVCRDYTEPIDLFDRHLYEKGGLVLHQLRHELGDDVFWRGIQSYLEAQRGGVVETNDLMRALERASGRSLERFFDQWVFRPGHPVLRIKVSYGEGLLTVHVKQTQKQGEVATFAFPLEVEVADESGTTVRHEKPIDSESDALVIPCPSRPRWVGVDPQFRIIGKVNMSAPNDMLKNQLLEASTARLRWMAARTLADRDDQLTVKALAGCLADERQPWMVRAEVALCLGRIRGELAFTSLADGAEIEHPKVRRAVASALGYFRSKAARDILMRLCKNDRSYLVLAAAARALGRTRQPGILPTLERLLRQDSWGEVVRAGALAGMANSRDEGAVDSVTRATAYGVPTRARRAAVSALPLLSEGRAVREHLENLLDDSDPYLRISAISALRTLGDSKARHALRVHIDRELDGRVARRAREAVRDLGQTASEQKKLGDDLEAVRSQLAELKTRLSKLEAKPTQGEKGDQGPESSAKQATRPRKKATRSPKKPSKTRTKVAKSGRTTRKKAKSRKKGRGRS